MATKKQKKKAAKVIKKAAKKKPKLFAALVVILLLLLIVAGVAWYLGYLDSYLPDAYQKNPVGGSGGQITETTTGEDKTTTTTVVPSGEKGAIVEDVIYEDFQIHFMMLGNDKAGDSVYIKAGATDILIDAGSRMASFDTTSKYINQYCKDGKLEYVIATHGDQDHIEAFPKFSNAYQFGTIISTRYTTKNTSSATSVYSKMTAAFTQQVQNGAKWYFTDDCWNNANGAARSYVLSDKVTMDILYNAYYFDGNGDGKGDTTDENNYSVCTLFTYNNNGEKQYFMLTGDLEKEGEKSLAEYYDASSKEKTLPRVDLFKAGHHGSKTSSNDCLLDIIQPKMCVVSCCCGTNEYTGVTDNQFPTQDFISRIGKWTDKVYVTSIYESFTIQTAVQKTDTDGNPKVDKNGNPVSDTTGVAIGGNYISTTGYKAMNGNVIVSANGISIGLKCSNSYTTLKDSEWLNTKIVIDGKERPMRVWPSA